jgi:hypothetical protein
MRIWSCGCWGLVVPFLYLTYVLLVPDLRFLQPVLEELAQTVLHL